MQAAYLIAKYICAKLMNMQTIQNNIFCFRCNFKESKKEKEISLLTGIHCLQTNLKIWLLSITLYFGIACVFYGSIERRSYFIRFLIHTYFFINFGISPLNHSFFLFYYIH